MPQKNQKPSNSDKITQNAVILQADGDSRSFDVVLSAETRVLSYFSLPNGDFVKGERIMLSSGFSTEKVPLIDSHQDFSIEQIFGSCDNIRVEGTDLKGTITLSANANGENALQLIREKHLTDVSIGAQPQNQTIIQAGKTAVINGRTFTASPGLPLRVVTQSRLVELSLCPIGADPSAKISASAGIDTAEQTQTKMEPIMTEDEIKQSIAAAAAAERIRISEINTICQSADLGEEAKTKFINEGSTVDAVRQAAFAAVVAKKQAPAAPAAPVGGSGVSVGEEKVDQFRRLAHESINQRGGGKIDHLSANDRKIVQELSGFGLVDLAEESLRLNQRLGSGRVSRDEIVKQALGTADFVNLFLNVGNKVALEGYQSVGFNWELFCDVGSVSNFNIHTGVGVLGLTEGLEEMPEGSEYTKSKIIDEKETWSVKTYGRAFDVTRQAIINDDIGGIMEAARQRGELVGELIADLAVAPINANQTMGDGFAAFGPQHLNLGTAGVLSETTMKEARIAMAAQARPNGRKLGYKPMMLLGPASMEEAAIKYFLANSPGSASGVVNPHYGMISQSNMLFDQRFTDASATAWYLLGKKLVRMFFLNGQRNPFLETVTNSNTDGLTFKVRIDAGSRLLNWRAGFKNAGA